MKNQIFARHGICAPRLTASHVDIICSYWGIPHGKSNWEIRKRQTGGQSSMAIVLSCSIIAVQVPIQSILILQLTHFNCWKSRLAFEWAHTHDSKFSNHIFVFLLFVSFLFSKWKCIFAFICFFITWNAMYLAMFTCPFWLDGLKIWLHKASERLCTHTLQLQCRWEQAISAPEPIFVHLQTNAYAYSPSVFLWHFLRK